MAVPSGMVCCLEGLREGLPGTFAGQTWGLAVCGSAERKVFPSVDCAPGLVAHSPSSGRLGHCCGCLTVPRGRVSVVTQVPCLQGSISTSGAPGCVLPRLFLFVGRAMAIAQLTQLHISIPFHRERPRGRYQKNVFRTARLHGD